MSWKAILVIAVIAIVSLAIVMRVGVLKSLVFGAPKAS